MKIRRLGVGLIAVLGENITTMFKVLHPPSTSNCRVKVRETLFFLKQNQPFGDKATNLDLRGFWVASVSHIISHTRHRCHTTYQTHTKGSKMALSKLQVEQYNFQHENSAYRLLWGHFQKTLLSFLLIHPNPHHIQAAKRGNKINAPKNSLWPFGKS